MNSLPRPLAYGLAALAIAVPWLNPFAPGPSPPVLQSLVTLVGVDLLLLLLAMRQLDGVNLARAAALGWLMAALVSSAIGLVQYFGASAALAPWVNGTGLGEAFANLRQRNQFATLTNIGLAALLWWVAQGPPAGKETSARGQTQAPILGFMAALLALGNASSSSRTGMVQLLLLGLCMALWSYFEKGTGNKGAQRRATQLILFTMAVYGLALWLLPRLAGLDAAGHGALARLIEGDGLCTSRITLWGNVLHLIAQKPWLGWGWGELSYAHYITLYPGTRFCDILDNAHNLPLQLAVELGVPAAVLLCGGAFVLALRARPWRESDPAKRVAWAVLAVIVLHSMLEYPLWYGPFWMSALLCLVLLVQSRPSTGPALRAQRGPMYGLAAFAAVALLAATAYTAWDYDRISQIFLPPSERAAAYQVDTLAKLRGSWLFRNQVRYAELTTTAVTHSNAARMHAMASKLLHFSPEARVIEKLLDADVQLGRNDEALFHMKRFRAAFPQEYARWRKAGSNAPDPLSD